RLGLAAALPTVCTLAVVYGAMGALGVHLDIGTSMLASLIIGAGVDYAVHLVAAHRAATQSGATSPLATAIETTSTAIWTNALMVGAGFYLLTLGEARTLQNVGGLTAAAMVVAAVSTFSAVPALLPNARMSAPNSVKSLRSDVG
ncbi:MAG: MMPL family transporter, partial [Myxococcota bacterium]